MSGFSLIELMVVVAILAILSALAAPSFTPLMERWRVRDSAENLQSTLYYARSEAIKRSGNVIITKSADTGSCTSSGSTQWNCGWVVFFDVNGNGMQDACVANAIPNECTLQVVSPPNRVTINLAGSAGRIAVDRWGMLSDPAGASVPTAMSFDLIPKGKTLSNESAARVCIASSGRMVRKKGSESC